MSSFRFREGGDPNFLASTHIVFTILTCAQRKRVHFCPQHWLCVIWVCISSTLNDCNYNLELGGMLSENHLPVISLYRNLGTISLGLRRWNAPQVFSARTRTTYLITVANHDAIPFSSQHPPHGLVVASP